MDGLAEKMPTQTGSLLAQAPIPSSQLLWGLVGVLEEVDSNIGCFFRVNNGKSIKILKKSLRSPLYNCFSLGILFEGSKFYLYVVLNFSSRLFYPLFEKMSVYFLMAFWKIFQWVLSVQYFNFVWGSPSERIWIFCVFTAKEGGKIGTIGVSERVPGWLWGRGISRVCKWMNSLNWKQKKNGNQHFWVCHIQVMLLLFLAWFVLFLFGNKILWWKNILSSCFSFFCSLYVYQDMLWKGRREWDYKIIAFCST